MAAPRNEDIKNKILDTVEKLLESRSYTDISLSMVASQAAISKGTLYYYYKSKGELFYDLTDRYLNRQWDDFIKWTENRQKDTSIQRLVRYVVERNVASANFRMQLFSEAQLGNDQLRKRLCQRYDEFHRLISEKIAERTNLPADYLTWMILLVSDGIIIQKVIGNDQFDADKIIDDSIRHLLNISK